MAAPFLKGDDMMRIKIINPDVNEAISKIMKARAEKYCAPGTEICCNSPSFGVHSVDNMFTWNISAVSVLDELLKSEKEGFDAYVIACFWNPGVLAAREITDKPVVGIGQASLMYAQMLGERASIICVGDTNLHIYKDDVQRYGMQNRIASYKSVNIASEDSFTNPSETCQKIAQAAREAVEQDHAEVILLGCGVMAEFSEKISELTGVPVINPIGAGVKMAESLAAMHLKNSKRYSYHEPVGTELVQIPGILNEV